jgi:hypothetical protein
MRIFSGPAFEFEDQKNPLSTVQSKEKRKVYRCICFSDIHHHHCLKLTRNTKIKASLLVKKNLQTNL